MTEGSEQATADSDTNTNIDSDLRKVLQPILQFLQSTVVHSSQGCFAVSLSNICADKILNSRADWLSRRVLAGMSTLLEALCGKNLSFQCGASSSP